MLNFLFCGSCCIGCISVVLAATIAVAVGSSNDPSRNLQICSY